MAGPHALSCKTEPLVAMVKFLATLSCRTATRLSDGCFRYVRRSRQTARDACPFSACARRSWTPRFTSAFLVEEENRMSAKGFEIMGALLLTALPGIFFGLMPGFVPAT